MVGPKLWNSARIKMWRSRTIWLLLCVAFLTFAGCRKAQDQGQGAEPARSAESKPQPASGTTEVKAAPAKTDPVKPEAAKAEPAADEPTKPEVAAAPVRDRKECVGKPVVTLEERTPDGVLFRKYEVVKMADGTDVQHGLNILYFPTGQKKLEVSYDCGVAHGPRVAWYEDGSSRSQGENIDGKNHGVWTVWFPDGTKSQEFTMDHGAWHGTYTTWHSNGQKRMQVQYVNGLQQGPLQQFDESGAMVRSVDQVDGVPQPMPGGRVVD